MEKHINMPFALDYETAVLGACLLETKAMPLAIKFLRAEMFYDDRHQTIFSALECMFNEGRSIDIITVTEELKRRGELEKVGGPFFIVQLSSEVASSAHLETHALTLKDYYIRRELIKGQSKMLAMAVDMTVYTEDAIAATQEMLDNLNKDAAWNNSLRDMETLMSDTIELAEERREKQEEGVTGIPTGLTDLDVLTSGWQKGEAVVIAARPAMGKTMVSLHLAKAAAKAGHNVLFCSIEMQGERLGDRLILLESDVNAHRWRSGQTAPDEWIDGQNTARELAKLPMMIDDNPSMSMDYIRAEARMLKSKGKCDMIIIDYLQLSDMKSNDRALRNREQEVAIATRKAKLMAKEMDCPVILLSQLNRDSETRPGKRPQLSDLRESGAIEQDADLVFLLYRPALAGLATDKESGYPTDGLGVIIVAKHRNGETGNVYFSHNKSMTKITDYTPPMDWLMNQKTN
jgi:replicative DNA helicase